MQIFKCIQLFLVFVTVGLVWDWKNMAFGSGIPATVDTDYHHKVIAGTTRATVAGTDTEGGDPLHINDLANSDDLTNLNRDRDAVQERHVAKDKHVRVFLPVIDPARFKHELGGIWDSFVEHVADVDSEAELYKLGELQDRMEQDEAVLEGDTRELFGYELVDESYGMVASGSLETLVSSNDELGGRLSITVIKTSEVEGVLDWEAIGVVESESVVRIIAKDSSGNEMLIEAEGNARGEWLGRETLAEVREEEVRRYVQDMFEYQQGFAKGFWIDGPRNVAKEVFGLVKSGAQLAWEALEDPKRAELKTFLWVLDRYVAGKLEWSEFRTDKQGYVAALYEEKRAAVADYLGRLAENPGEGGAATFALAAALAPIPAGNTGTIVNKISKELRASSRFVDEIKDIANALPESLEFARVIKPDQVKKLKSGDMVSLSDYPGATETFITTSEALPRGLSKKELAKMLTIREHNVGGIIRFKLDGEHLENLATPYNRFEMDGFVNGGKTDGGLPEFVIPNREIGSLKYEIEILD